MLTILIAARLAGMGCLTALCDFGRALSLETLAAIGSRLRPQTGRCEVPGISSWHYILKRIDVAEAERLLAAWASEQALDTEDDSAAGGAAGSGGSEAPLRAATIDGKVLRGSHDRDLGKDGKLRDKPPQQQLSALEIRLRHGGRPTRLHGPEGRCRRGGAAPVGRAVRRHRDLHHGRRAAHPAQHGGEAAATQAPFCAHGEGNQPTLLAEVRDGFHWDCMPAHTTTVGDHGRIETRSIRVSDELGPAVPYVNFPGVRLVAQVRRKAVRKQDGKRRKPETVCLVTSLGPDQVTPQQWLHLNRSHWGIENRVHYVRDVAVGGGQMPHPQGLAAAVDGGGFESRDLDPATAGDDEHPASHEPAVAGPERDRGPPAQLNPPAGSVRLPAPPRCGARHRCVSKRPCRNRVPAARPSHPLIGRTDTLLHDSECLPCAPIPIPMQNIEFAWGQTQARGAWGGAPAKAPQGGFRVSAAAGLADGPDGTQPSCALPLDTALLGISSIRSAHL